MRASFAAACAGLLAFACRSSEPFLKEPRWPAPKHGAVVCQHPIATAIGIAILDRGGNAADAAVATALALAVVHPQAGNLGGGGFALWVPHTGDARAFDFRETAPAAASSSRFLGRDGKRVVERSLEGPLAVAVPGTPAGLAELHRQCGSRALSFPDLVRPAIALAQNGFVVDAWLAHDLAKAGERDRMNASARATFYPRGQPLTEGALCRQPELAATLAVYANQGARGFYTGPVADAIVRAIDTAPIPQAADDPSGPRTARGWITREDLERYRVRERTPLAGWFRGMEIVTMPPPSSGGILLLQMLGILEGMPLDAERASARESHALAREKTGQPSADDPGLGERMVHWWVEAMRRGFADRAEHMGDPDYVDVPVERLLSPEWIAERRTDIGEHADLAVRPMPSDEGVGAPYPRAPAREGSNTTHVSVIDRHGNALSLTTTLNDTFGNHMVVSGGGFFLNNEMDDFAIQPDSPNLFGLVGGAKNAVAPGKRPLSSMTPTVVRWGGHVNTMVLGSPGGPRIVTSVAEVLLRTLVLGATLEEAVRAPRVHQQWSPATTRFEEGFDPAIATALAERRGHVIEWSDITFGCVQALWISSPGADPIGVSDPRGGGTACVQGKKPSQPARPPARARP